VLHQCGADRGLPGSREIHGHSVPIVHQAFDSSTSFADAFDLFIDLRILRTFLADGVVALHCRSLSYGAVDATSRRPAGGIARCSNRCRTCWRAAGLEVDPEELAAPAELVPGVLTGLAAVPAPLGSLPELLRPPTLGGVGAPTAELAPADPNAVRSRW
jgi:hypothetical protein